MRSNWRSSSSSSKQDKAIAIKVSGRVQGLNNTLTNYKGMHEGLVKGGSLAKKKAQEEALEAWIAADPARKAKYGDVLPALRALQAEGEKTREQSSTLATVVSSSTYLGAAQTLYRLSLERAKADIDREAGYQQRDWPRLRDAQERIQRTIDPTSDRACSAGRSAWPPPCPPISASKLSTKPPASGPACRRMTPLKRSIRTSSSSTPAPASTIASSASACLRRAPPISWPPRMHSSPWPRPLEPMLEANRETAKKRAGAASRLGPRYMEALLAKSGGLVAPDANSTLRVTYGQVKACRRQGWSLLQAPDHHLRHRPEAHRRGRF